MSPFHFQSQSTHVQYTGTSGTTPHGKNESIARAGIERKHEWHDTARLKQEHRTRQKGRSSREFALVLSGMIIQHTPPPDTAVELCMPCQALSTSVRHNARGARDAAQVATPRSIERFVPMFQCSGAKLGEVTWRGVSGMGSLYLDR